MKLSNLLKGIDVEIKGSKNIEITGISADSRTIFPGNLFIAKKGFKFNGVDFIPQAVKSGAVAVVTDIYDPFLPNVAQIVHCDVASIEADIAANFYGFPAKELFCIGITGTNGKTTTAYLIKHILDNCGKLSGLIGTVEYILGEKKLLASRTTPDVISNQKFLREMINEKCSSLVMEVTSHALEQERAKHIDFDAAIFTNLTQDHLDYHETIENYLNAKKKLFSNLKATSRAIINVDDVHASEIVSVTKAPILTYGIEKRADLMASNISFSPNGSKFLLRFKGEEFLFSTPLIGRFNVYNILAASGAAITADIPLQEIAKSILSFEVVRGRLEKVETNRGFYIFVDFAHTEDALKNVLSTLNEVKRARLIVVFGCGGDRDRQKRPKMGKVCMDLADFSIITSDNPRSEEPLSIIEEIRVGFSDKSRYIIEEDRFKAIEKAIHMARGNDIILIAGKGHEPYQIFKDKTIVFDDRDVVKQIL